MEKKDCVYILECNDYIQVGLMTLINDLRLIMMEKVRNIQKEEDR